MEKSDEAERLLSLAEKLLSERDLSGSREFAILAQETEPLLEGSDQILAVVDVLIASDRRLSANQLDWYSILQIDHPSDDLDSIKRQYRRLALLLHPDKNRFPHADHAFKLVAQAWAVLSDPAKKLTYDNEFDGYFSAVDLSGSGWVNQEKLPVRRAGPGSGGAHNGADVADVGSGSLRRNNSKSYNNVNTATFWTACPYCYLLCEYEKVYEGYCLRCQNCERSFHGVSIPTLPPLVAGQEAYYCCWGFFPLNLATANGAAGKSAPPAAGFPTWPPPAGAESARPAVNGWNSAEPVAVAGKPAVKTAAGGVSSVSNGMNSGVGSSGKKRGRPRKNAL